jgi:hypothetical protein
MPLSGAQESAGIKRGSILSSSLVFWLSVEDDHRIVVGEKASQPSAERIMRKYRSTGAEAHFVASPYTGAPPEERAGMLLMLFNREQLGKAAAIGRATLMNQKHVSAELARCNARR